MSIYKATFEGKKNGTKDILSETKVYVTADGVL